MLFTITVNSRCCGKQTGIEVEVTRVTLREVSYIALDKTFSGTLGSFCRTSRR
jgi:hypothetical protein